MPHRSSSKQRVQVLSSKVVYRGPVFYVTAEQVREPGGVTVRRDVVHHQGSVVIMAIDKSSPEPRVLLTRQYRYAAENHLWELPAGRIDTGEDHLAAAKRELQEETGYTARDWERILFFYVSPGFLNEFMVVYLARNLKKGTPRPEEDEVITKRLFPVSRAATMVMRGALQDSKTISGLLWLEKAWREGTLSGTRVPKRRAALMPGESSATLKTSRPVSKRRRS